MADDLDAAFCEDEETCDKGSESESEIEEYVKAPIDKAGPVGRWIRHRLLASILIGMPPLRAIQRMRTPLRTKVMKVCSFLGTEDFYTVLVGLFTWIIDAKLGRLLCLLMGFGFYAAGFIKELLCLPRPPNPPIVPLEKSAFHTWGLPSHHAVLGVLIPWYIWFFSLLHFGLSQWSLTALFIVIALWSISVMFSRLYLGIHSPADIVAGGIVGCLMLSFWMKVDSFVERYISLADNVGVQALVYALVLLIVHPRPSHKSVSFTETICMVGVTVGFVMGRSSTGRNSAALKAVMENVTELTPWFTILWVSLARLVVGFSLVLLTRAVCKVIFSNLVAGAFRLIGVDFISNKSLVPLFTGYNKSFKLPPVLKDGKKQGRKSKSSESGRTKLNVDYPVKFVTYICMGCVCVCGSPMLCHYLGLAV